MSLYWPVLAARERVHAFCWQWQGLYGASILRAALGAIMFEDYLWHFRQRGFLWGPHGQVAFSDFIVREAPTFLSLYAFSKSELWAEAIYWTSLIVALLFCLGVATRLLCWPFAVLTYSNLERNIYAHDAGLILLTNLAFCLCFMKSDRYLRVWQRSRTVDVTNPFVMQLHNAARIAVTWQISMVYLWASFYKIAGSEWRHGVALYYILNLERFESFPALSHIFASHASLLAVASDLIVFSQMAMAFLVWNSRLKPFVIALGLLEHVAIGAFMGLISFSATVMAADISLLNDAQIMRFSILIKKRSVGLPSMP